MARTGSSSKFVPVNLNNSYGQTLPMSNGGASASSTLGRSRSFTSSYGGMVALSRSSRVSSSSPSSASVSASSRASKLAIPRPMNLPSLRREHSGNDPTIALVGSSGSSGWTKQTGDEVLDVSASRSDSHSASWGNRPPASDASIQITDRRVPLAGRQSAYSPPGPGDASINSTPVEKAVVFRGEDFPTLQAAAVPYSPSLPLPPRSRDLLSKQQQDKRTEDSDEFKQKVSASGYNHRQSNCYFDQQFQPAQPVRMQVRGTFSEKIDFDADRGGAYSRGPSPLVKLTHTSNWADDERETLSSFQPQESAQLDWAEPNDGFRSTGNWQRDHNGDVDFRRPTSRTGYPTRSDTDSSMRMESPLRTAYGKDGDLSRGPSSGGARFEPDSRGGFDRMSNNARRNDFLKRGWSFSAAESNLNRDGRFTYSNNGSERENHASGKAFTREGNNVRHDTAGGDMLMRDGRPGFYHLDAAPRQEFKFGKDILLGRQGFPGGVSPGPRTGRGPGFSYNGSDVALPSKQQPETDHRRDKRASGFYGHVHDDDPFLGDGIGTRPTSLYALQPRIKKSTSKDHDYHDPARESFEAELERVEKMLEQERQRAVEERERAIELARKEQEEQERLAREEEEMRIKQEQEVREAAYRAQIEAEDAARRVEETRKAREEEKRMAELEDERRKEAARKKLLELEQRMAKREAEKKREEDRQTERGSTERESTLKTVSANANIEHQDNGRRSTDTSRESHWKSGKVDENESEQLSSMVPLPINSSALPSILRSPRLSPYSKEENSSSIEGARVSQTWKRDALDSGHDFRLVRKGSHGTLHLQNDHPQQEHEDRHWGSSFRNASIAAMDAQRRPNIDPDAADERNWWVRETSNKSQYPVEAYSQSAEASEYPSFGRLRQSLPRQPRVLPPPPGPTGFRKQFVQRDDIHSGASTFDTERMEMAPTSKEELSLPSIESNGSHEVGIKESLVTNIQVAEQFDSVPSEEVVLSDAGSQFSDDTVEEVVTEAYQEQELHSDAVSETYTEGEVDEISDITEAQESSEDLESQKPTIWEAHTGEEKADSNGETPGQGGKDNLKSSQKQHDSGTEGFIVFNKIEEEEEIVNEPPDSGRNITSSSLLEDVANANADDVCGTEEAEKPAATQSVMCSGFKGGQEPVGNTEELASETVEQDQEIQLFPYQAPFLPVGSGDATQIRHLESVSSRQSLVQQFQQPFSFMAVPLPQSSTLSHVGGSVPMLTPVHGLPNQQDLPFHLQLGLLPGVPLMPNAIQIGSIQMPLHIHPQIPQLAHVHSQQPPVFQFGQIGPSLPMSQPLSMPHMSQPAAQMHHSMGQVNITQQHLQADFVSAIDTKNDSVDLNQLAKFADLAAEGASLPSGGHNLAFKEDVEVKQGASAISEGSRVPAEREVQRPLEEPEKQSATVSVSKLDGQKTSIPETFESCWDGDRDQAELKARPGGKPSRGGRRRTGAPRYQGILGRGRGRFHGGQNHFYQATHLTSENWPEGGPKRFGRGKMIRRGYRRAEYRVREPSSNFDGESAVAEFSAAPASNIEDSKEAGGYRYVKKGLGSQPKNAGEENGQPRSRVLQTIGIGDQPANQSVPAPISKTQNLLKKYEMENAEDAPFRTGVVCVFEQPGIETPNDKDDFIKVRSKRQLLRELREQREKESKIRGTDFGPRDQVSKKQQRSSAKSGINAGAAGAHPTKNIGKRKPTRSAENVATDGKINTPSSISGATGISSVAVGKRNFTSRKPGRAVSASKVVATGTEGIVSFAHDHTSEQLTIAAWGGQRSNQEVVSLTQIQLEEAMKPFRLDGPFSESACLSEKASMPLEPGSCSSAVAVEKPVITSGPLSSLLAGEKIQFGAVTSPTPMPSNSRSSTPISAVRTGSPLGFGTESSHMPGHTSSFVTNFLEPPLDVTFSVKGDSANKDNGFEGKVADLELEAEAEAAASAVVAAAISSEDLIESHTNRRVSEMNAGCTTLTSANPLTVQIQSNSASDNPMAVALPADLSVETPPSLFQGSSMGPSNLSGVMLQSLPNGTPAFPCLEMGPLLGGPVFNFGPREDSSLASMEPGLSGWQQRHVGTPDSYYGAPPFLSPGISSIQGHPHMLVYANPYTPVGQFGQLGVSFMGAAYHPSGKQPDWTHIPFSSTSSGALALNNGDLSPGTNGPIASQHLNGQRAGVAASPVMSVAAPPNLFDAGLAAPFQVPQMDGFMQSHWSKAPAPPVHSVPIPGSSLPSQSFPLSKPAVDLNMQIHSSWVFANQAGHSTHSVDASSVFHKPPVLNPASSSSFSSADAGAQFPDELGFGDSMPTVNTSQGDAGGPLPEASHANMLASVETTGIKMQRGRCPARSSQGNLSSVNSNSGGQLISAANSQEQSRSSRVSLEFQSKNLGRIGTPSLRTGSLQFAEQRASKQGLPKESAGSEWPRSSQRKGGGRVSTSDRGGSVLPSKLKQIYVAKPAADAGKRSAACS